MSISRTNAANDRQFAQCFGLALIGFTIGVIVTIAVATSFHPADRCHEDEAYWWVANDVRACMPVDDIVR